MGDPEGIDPNDPCRLASRLSRGEGQVHLEVGAVDGVAERVEERGVTLERANRLLPLVLIRESQRDVVLVLLRVGVSRQVGFLHHRDDEQRLEQLPDAVLPRPLRRERRRVHLSLPRLLRVRPRQNVRHGHGVVRSFQVECTVGRHGQEQARVGERQPDAVGRLENGVEPGHRDAGGAKRVLAGSAAREHRAEQAGAYEARGPPGYAHHGSEGKDQDGQSMLTGLPLESRPVPRAAIRVDNRRACPSRFGETACWRHRPPRTPARAPCRDPRASGAARCPCRSAAGRCRSLPAPASA